MTAPRTMRLKQGPHPLYGGADTARRVWLLLAALAVAALVVWMVG